MTRTILYGSPLSLYTGRARSYLIKAGIDYHEQIHNSEHYLRNVLPKAGNRQGIPTLETEEGEVIRDGAAIIDHYEAIGGHMFSPVTPKQRIVSRLFDVIGCEGLLRPAMHYRWNFDAENLDFLTYHFNTMAPRTEDAAEKAERLMNNMRNAAMAFGAVPDTFELVESLYMELLASLNEHFSNYPYLLGNRPCIGDFGMIAPLYAHLGRDPKPLSLMQTHAIRLFRWVERMNRPEPDIGEFGNHQEGYLPGDEIPASLTALMKQIAVDFVPETIAAAICINEWLSQQEDLAPGSTAERGVGFGSFELSGSTINALAQPYRFYLLQRVQDEFEALNSDEQTDVTSMLTDAGMQQMLTTKLDRRIGRQNNLEVWL